MNADDSEIKLILHSNLYEYSINGLIIKDLELVSIYEDFANKFKIPFQYKVLEWYFEFN